MNLLTRAQAVVGRLLTKAGIKFTDVSSASATAGAATCNAYAGTITSEALTTAAGADYVLTLTNDKITASSTVLAAVEHGTNTTEGLLVGRITPAAGSVVIRVRNAHASSALNGTIKVKFLAFN